MSEGGNGIQVVNLANVDNGSVSLVNTITTGDLTATHNVAVNTPPERLPVPQRRRQHGPAHLRPEREPDQPRRSSASGTQYVHDVQIVDYTSGLRGHGGDLLLLGFNNGYTQTGLDPQRRNKANPVVLGEAIRPPPTRTRVGCRIRGSPGR
ncbi:MAG: hypothetical protein R3E96_03380 [Planctomycetota bacterium]